MVRRKRWGQPVDGWLAIDKGQGLTSADTVGAVKRLFSARKVGHAGTLDRPATGVLALAFGEATKTIPFVMDAPKSYRFRVRFGQATSTDDATGDIIAESGNRPSRPEILDALDRFRGEIQQRPPLYSAVKVAGRRAASLAAAGEAPELASRPLTVHQLELVCQTDPHSAEFDLVCGKGGYVRSIARDLGEALGCLAHVVELRRLATGPFRIEDCRTLDQLRDLDPVAELPTRLLPLEFGLASLTKLECSEEQAASIRNGKSCLLASGSRRPVWVACQRRAVATGELREGMFRPRRVFAAPAADGEPGMTGGAGADN